MKTTFIQEPELEFGGGRHIDIRFGLMHHGPLDARVAGGARTCRVGIVGDGEGIDNFRAWIDSCRSGIPAKQTRLKTLFPKFPGFGDDGCLPDFLVHESWSRLIPARDTESLCQIEDTTEFTKASVDRYVSEAASLIEKGQPDVVICLLPAPLIKRIDVSGPVHRGPRSNRPQHNRALVWHDYFKAECLRLSRPVQLSRPGTFGGDVQRYTSDGAPSLLIQDEATRAWNFFCALYYKAGGVPWRLIRDASELLTCYVGVSFYHDRQEGQDESVQTSVAQVFNERGEGVVIRGAPAQIRKDDRTPHLSEEQSASLLSEAIERFRQEHKTMPARIVLHKSSWFDEAERCGVNSAAADHRIEVVDLLSLRRTMTRFFRKSGAYPPLRGTGIRLDESHVLFYTFGSVDFYKSYPGLYTPRPLLVQIDQTSTGVPTLLTEILGLTKMNWNSTQFVNSHPITLAASRSVGDILRYAPRDARIQARYSFYM